MLMHLNFIVPTLPITLNSLIFCVIYRILVTTNHLTHNFTNHSTNQLTSTTGPVTELSSFYRTQ